MKMETAATTELQRQDNPTSMISLALSSNADPEVLKKLMDLQERWEKNDARKDYMEALGAFKRAAPAVLAKDETVDFATAKGRTNYRYAGLGGIVRQITVILSDCGLNASWETHQDKDTVAVTCHVTHVKGHRESTTLSGPLDNSGNKNLIQQLGSTVTYLQRYTLLALLGLATSEQDDDASGGKKGNDHPPAQRRESAKPAAAEAPPAKSASGANVAQGILATVTTKNGMSKRGAWVKYGLKIDGEWYGTFDEKIGETAESIQGERVSIEWKEDGKYKTVTDIALLGEAPAPIELIDIDDDLPYDPKPPNAAMDEEIPF